MSEKIWYDDLLGFLGPDNYYLIVPLQSMSIEEKLNASIRFFLYISIILAIITKDSRYLFFAIVAGLISIGIYEFEKKKVKTAEKFLEKKQLDIVDNTLCARSTIENPFMNVLMSDYTQNPQRPGACGTMTDKVQKTIDKNFHARLFRDVNDIYGKNASEREFYTMPNTTIPNNREGFTDWLFGRGPSCKEGNGFQCDHNIYRTVDRHL